MTNGKKIFYIFLYLIAFILVIFSVYCFSMKYLSAALILSSVAMLIYTWLILKEIKILSSVSFFTVPLMSLLILGSSGSKTGGLFLDLTKERIFMVALAMILFFLIFNSFFWARTKKGFKRFISLIGLGLLIIIVAAFGISSPEYYQNFVYTRLYVLLLLIFGIFLIISKKKILGILGLLLSISVLLLSAAMFAEKVYLPDNQEQKEIVAFIDPMIKEMFDYYNKEDYNAFSENCGLVLKNMLVENPLKNIREAFGPYIQFFQPSRAIRQGGFYRIEYPVKFEQVQELRYLLIVFESISPGSKIYDFNLSEKKEIPFSFPDAEVIYNCQDNKSIQAAFYEEEEVFVEPGEMPIPSGRVEIILSDGRSFNLPRTLSASGIRYANQDESVIFWSKGETAFLMEAEETTFQNCLVDEAERD